MIERPCDCAGHHLRFPDRDPGNAMLYPPRRPFVAQPIPVLHQHENDRCSKPYLGIGGCPGLPHCRDWIIGTYNAGITIAEATGDNHRAFELRLQCDSMERAFACLPPLADGRDA